MSCCCYHTCCKKCAEDIGTECHCYQTVDRLVICEKKPNDMLKKCEDSLIQANKNGTIGLNRSKTQYGNYRFHWKNIKKAFKKSEILYQERLDTIKQLNSCNYYVSDIPLFENNLPEHNLVRNGKGKKTVLSKKFEEFFKTYK